MRVNLESIRIYYYLIIKCTEEGWGLVKAPESLIIDLFCETGIPAKILYIRIYAYNRIIIICIKPSTLKIVSVPV